MANINDPNPFNNFSDEFSIGSWIKNKFNDRINYIKENPGKAIGGTMGGLAGYAIGTAADKFGQYLRNRNRPQ